MQCLAPVNWAIICSNLSVRLNSVMNPPSSMYSTSAHFSSSPNQGCICSTKLFMLSPGDPTAVPFGANIRAVFYFEYLSAVFQNRVAMPAPQQDDQVALGDVDLLHQLLTGVVYMGADVSFAYIDHFLSPKDFSLHFIVNVRE